MGEETKDILLQMIEKSYLLGIVPKDFTQSRTTLIPKKGSLTECNIYRTISLFITHTSKIL